MNPKDLSTRMQQVATRARPDRPGAEPPRSTTTTAEEVPLLVGGELRSPGTGRTHRVTVDLDDGAYALLRRTALEWFVPGSAVLRALLAEMADDSELARRVRFRAARR